MLAPSWHSVDSAVYHYLIGRHMVGWHDWWR